MKNETANGNSNARLESLLAKEKQLLQALAAERLKLAKREKREAEKEEPIIDAALYLAEGHEPWAARHNAETWYWRNQADGFYE